MNFIAHARKLRPIIEKAAAHLDDLDALEAVELFPEWSATATYAKDDRVRYAEVLYKCLTAHTAQADWTPVAAPSLWAKVLIPDEDVIPEWEQPDSTNPYMIGDKVMYNGSVWESIVDNNVWTPGTAGVWEEKVD